MFLLIARTLLLESSLALCVCRVVMHVDMDCFFASVSVRNRPELQGVPLAVAHSNHSGGHSEISCVNYVARKAGVSAAMWMAQARER